MNGCWYTRWALPHDLVIFCNGHAAHTMGFITQSTEAECHELCVKSVFQREAKM